MPVPREPCERDRERREQQARFSEAALQSFEPAHRGLPQGEAARVFVGG